MTCFKVHSSVGQPHLTQSNNTENSLSSFCRSLIISSSYTTKSFQMFIDLYNGARSGTITHGKRKPSSTCIISANFTTLEQERLVYILATAKHYWLWFDNLQGYQVLLHVGALNSTSLSTYLGMHQDAWWLSFHHLLSLYPFIFEGFSLSLLCYKSVCRGPHTMLNNTGVLLSSQSWNHQRQVEGQDFNFLCIDW